MQREGMDELDGRILELIRDNARMTFQEISEIVGVSRVSVRTRMKAMEERGIIRGYQTIVDPTAHPDGIRFFLDVDCTPESFEDMAEELAHNEMVRQLYTVSGEGRLHAVGYTPNARNLEYFANTLYRRKHGVRRISFQMVLSTLMDRDGGAAYERFEEEPRTEEKRG